MHSLACCISAGSSIQGNGRQMVSYLHSASSIDSSLRKSARSFILSESFQTLCGSKASEELHSQLLEHWQVANGKDASFEESITEGIIV